jgi:hypothetical protein
MMSFPTQWVSKLLDRLSLRKRADASRDRKRLLVERLEGRDLPATITLASGVLTYAAGAGVNNNLSVTVSGSNFVFNDVAETITTGVSGASGSGTNTVNVPTAGVTGIALNLSDGSDTINSTGVVVTNVNLTVNALNALTLAGNVSTGTGTISLLANQDGDGSEGLSQTGTITTTNTTANALAITVNTAGGGTGNASIRTISATGGTLTVQSFGGSILFAGTDTLTAFQTAQTTLATGILGPQGNGGAVPTGTVNAKTYNLSTSTTGSGSIGTAARPIHVVSVASNSATLNAGSGGVYTIAEGEAT